MKKIIAVFVAKQDWLEYEYYDHTRSGPVKITTGEAFVNIANGIDSYAWLALQKALCNQGQWIPVAIET